MNILSKLTLLPKNAKLLIVVVFDVILLFLVILASFYIRLGEWYWPNRDILWVIFITPWIATLIFYSFGLYKRIVRFIGFYTLWTIVKASSVYALLWSTISFMATIKGMPRSVILINWILVILAVSSSRIVASWLLNIKNNLTDKKNVAIYGAGYAGRQLSTALMQTSEYNNLVFIDDDKNLQGRIINDIKIYAKKDFDFLIKKKSITEVLIAIPSITRANRNQIINFLTPYAILVRSLPGIAEIASGKVKIEDLHEININDLLGRDSITANKQLLNLNIANKIVMVTGAGGSIGSELCCQILQLCPAKLILFELNEFSLYNIDLKLSAKNKLKIPILAMLGSVNNKNLLTHILKNFKVQTIYHAAAYKHVPLVEFNHISGVDNNIFGTINCAQAAIEAKIKTFVFISTDKAVHPTNVMGATKRFAEIALQALAKKQNTTIFSIVRFGNVLASSGSVIPLFKKQIKTGGPVTVTDARVTRYFMTTKEAVGLVIQAGAMSLGGDIFILNMGKPIRIVDLAKKMIRLSGLKVKDKDNIDGDIEIKYTGLRPGEKLYEELIIGNKTSATSHPMITCAEEKFLTWAELKTIINSLNTAIINCEQKIINKLLTQVVPEFTPKNKINDILYNNTQFTKTTKAL